MSKMNKSCYHCNTELPCDGCLSGIVEDKIFQELCAECILAYQTQKSIQARYVMEPVLNSMCTACEGPGEVNIYNNDKSEILCQSCMMCWIHQIDAGTVVTDLGTIEGFANDFLFDVLFGDDEEVNGMYPDWDIIWVGKIGFHHFGQFRKQQQIINVS
jgi:hypothetical protein